ncbi:MAG: MraY family glycosyltransferase, partial [Planctomycetaceae bacterium]
GADGVASTVGAVMAITTAAIAWTVEARPDGMLVSLALAGGLIGFLFHNLPPAKMFLGDSGSMVAGLILGAITIKCSIKEASAIALLMPLAVWTVPIFDSSMAIVRRKLTGRSIYATDRNHLHHCLLRSGHDNVRVLLVIATLCSISGGAAVLSAYFNEDGFAIAGAVSSIVLLVVTKSFGFVEAKLILRRAARFVRSLTIFSPGDKPTFSEAISLHGVQDWAGLFAGLESTLIEMDLAFVELCINIPAVNEDWHGHSSSKNTVDNLDLYRLTFPLKVSGQTVGTLRIHAAASSYPSPAKFLAELHSDVNVFENKLNAMIQPILDAAAVSEASKLREPPLDRPPQAAHP